MVTGRLKQVGVVRDWGENGYAEAHIREAAALGVMNIFHFGSYGLARGGRGEIDKYGRNWTLENIEGLCVEFGITGIFITPSGGDSLALARLDPGDGLPLRPHATTRQVIAPTDAVTWFAKELAQPSSGLLQLVRM